MGISVKILHIVLIMSRLVMDTLQPLPQERKCFRLINGVLVERTIQDVLPALKTNSDGLKQVLEELLKQYRNKQEEMDKWKVTLNTSVEASAIATSADQSQKKNNVQVVQNP